MSVEAEKKPRARARERKTEPTAGQVTYLVARKPLKVGDQTFQIGDVVPGAAEWPRVESWVRAGRLTIQQ